PVDDGAERRLLRRERLVADRVAFVRDDVPRHGDGRDPDLDHPPPRVGAPGGWNGDQEREGQERKRSRPTCDQRFQEVTTTVPVISGPCSMQMYLYVPAFVNVTR